METDAALPSIGDALAPIIARTPPERLPLLVALAERLAAARYREWATADPSHAAALCACAEREEDIAARVEGLHLDAAAIQRALRDATPEIGEINGTLFAGRPLADQYRIQAAGERLGAATWRSLAKRDDDARRRDVFLACAVLEEASAVVLEGILAEA